MLVRTTLTCLLAALFAFSFTACKSKQAAQKDDSKQTVQAQDDTKSSKDSDEGKTARHKKERAPKDVGPFNNAPEGHAFAKILRNMSSGEVVELLGHPQDEHGNVTGRAFNPWDFRGRGAYAMVYHYKGKGRIYLESNDKYSNVMRVCKVVYDPDEPGYVR